MATLNELHSELLARRERLERAERQGWRDGLADERRSVAEIDHVIDDLLKANMGRLLEVAGEIDLGALPAGVSLHFSRAGT